MHEEFVNGCIDLHGIVIVCRARKFEQAVPRISIYPSCPQKTKAFEVFSESGGYIDDR